MDHKYTRASAVKITNTNTGEVRYEDAYTPERLHAIIVKPLTMKKDDVT